MQYSLLTYQKQGRILAFYGKKFEGKLLAYNIETFLQRIDMSVALTIVLMIIMTIGTPKNIESNEPVLINAINDLKHTYLTFKILKIAFHPTCLS